MKLLRKPNFRLGLFLGLATAVMALGFGFATNVHADNTVPGQGGDGGSEYTVEVHITFLDSTGKKQYINDPSQIPAKDTIDVPGVIGGPISAKPSINTDGTVTYKSVSVHYGDTNTSTVHICSEVLHKCIDYKTGSSSTAKIDGTVKNTTDTSAIAEASCGNGGTKDASGNCTSGNGGTLDCDFNGNPLTWIVCPIIDSAKEFITKVDDIITGALTIDTDTIFQKVDAYHTAWNSFRVLATGLLVIGGLVMVASQALGFEFLDAYTIRKVLPRLLVAIIGISLSWPLMEFMVKFANTLGVDVRQLIEAPFKSIQGSFSSSPGGLLGVNLALIGTGAVLGIAGALSFGLTAILALLVGFVIIMVRDLALTLIIILAPLAIACYILPNTQKAWKLWIDNFLGLLLVFPIIEAFIAAGRAFSAVSLSKYQVTDLSGVSGSGASTINHIIGFLAYFLPYFLLPIAFRLATGAIGSIAGMVNDRGRGAFDGLKNYRGNKRKENIAGMRNYSRVGDKTAIGRGVNTVLGAGSHPMDALRGRKGIRAGRYAGRTMQGAAELKEDPTFQANQNDDNFLLAVANRRLAEQKLAAAKSRFAGAKTMDERNSAQADIDARTRGLDAASRMNVNTRNRGSTRQAALSALTRTGYQFGAGKQGYQELQSTVESIAGSDRGAATAMMDESQFNLKGAGRFDLGGINHGAGYSYATGVGKSSGYTLGNGKTESFIAGAAENFGAGAVGSDGKTQAAPELSRALQASLRSGETTVEKVGQWHSTLIDASMSGTVANKAEALKQMQAIEDLRAANPALDAVVKANQSRARRAADPDKDIPTPPATPHQ